MSDATCVICSAAFNRVGNQRTCSDQCSLELSRSRKWPTRPSNLCCICGESFTRTGQRQVTCSGNCRREQRRRMNAVLRGSQDERQCVVCLASFVRPIRQGMPPNTCSASCRKELIKRRQKASDAKNEHRWRAYKHKRDAIRRSRGKAATVPGERFTLDDVFARDNGVCHLCGKDVDRSLSFTDAMGPTMDHLVPLVAGGAHSLANVALAHRSCNSSKGTRAVGEQLRLIG